MSESDPPVTPMLQQFPTEEIAADTPLTPHPGTKPKRHHYENNRVTNGPTSTAQPPGGSTNLSYSTSDPTCNNAHRHSNNTSADRDTSATISGASRQSSIGDHEIKEEIETEFAPDLHQPAVGAILRRDPSQPEYKVLVTPSNSFARGGGSTRQHISSDRQSSDASQEMASAPEGDATESHYGFDPKYRWRAIANLKGTKGDISQLGGVSASIISPESSVSSLRSDSVPRQRYTLTNVFDKWQDMAIKVMKKHTCLETIPTSSKVVVFDTKLPLKHAFRALAEHDIKCAPVWSSRRREFIGLMTVTDFADILMYYAKDRSTFSQKISSLENLTVGSWAKWRKRHRTTIALKKSFVSVVFDEPIFNAARKLHRHFINRVPVLTEKHGKSILGVLNYSKILRFVMQQLEESHRTSINVRVRSMDFDFSIKYPTLKASDSLFRALELLSSNKKVSAIPVVDPKTGVVEDAFLRSDIRFLAIDRSYMSLEVPVSKFFDKHKPSRSVPMTTLDENIFDVLLKMLSKRNHLSLVRDAEHRLIGMVSLRDVFSLLLLGVDRNKATMNSADILASQATSDNANTIPTIPMSSSAAAEPPQ